MGTNPGIQNYRQTKPPTPKASANVEESPNLVNKKNGFDGMSRKSTAMSTNEDSIHLKRQGSGYKKSARGQNVLLASSNTETGNIIAEANTEAMILSLDPKTAKSKKPTKLKPLVPSDNRKKKKEYSGNYAAEVLAELEERDRNKKINSDIKMLDREIKGFLKFDATDLQDEMNSAFGGDSYEARVAKKNENQVAKKKRVDQILKEAQAMQGPGVQTNLDPILEESKHAVALYKPNMTLEEQRKQKNAELKHRVKQM